MKELVDFAEQRITRGSVSFSFAAKLFPRAVRENAFLIYAWCRHCDDVTDGSDLGRASSTHAPANLGAVFELESFTRRAMQGPEASLPAPFAALALANQRSPFPVQYCLDLLAGMRADAEGRRYETLADLRHYAYQVAGTVGLMMSHQMGLHREDALDEAVRLGIALQLTNIARDVREDFGRGRLYLPLAWLREAGLTEANCLDPSRASVLYGLVQRLLDVADEDYTHGRRGLAALPWRAALAVGVAASVYRGIGEKIRRLGPRALEERAILSRGERLGCALRGTFWVLRTTYERLRQPQRKPVLIQRIWRPQ